MRKILIVAAALAVISCSKQDDFVTLSFGVGGVSEHPITKGYVEDVQSLIASRMPESIPLTLTRVKSGKHYAVSTGEAVTLPVGEYTITASVSPSSEVNFPRQGMSASATPSISISESVTVVSGTSEYALTPTFDCFAIVALSECSEYTYRHSNANGSVSGEGIKLAFFKWDNNYELIVTAKPGDYDTKDDARFTFGGTGVQTRNGRFYVLHPESVTTEDGGFIFNVGSWTEGSVE